MEQFGDRIWIFQYLIIQENVMILRHWSQFSQKIQITFKKLCVFWVIFSNFGHVGFGFGFGLNRHYLRK